MDSVFHALWLEAQTREIQCYSPQSEAKLALVTSKIASRLAIVPNEEISQINQEAIKRSYKTNQLLRMWLVHAAGPLWYITKF